MALKIWATQNAVDTTGTGTTDFTHGTVTNTPVAALHFLTDSTANDTPNNQLSLAMGMSDGTDDRWSSVSVQHNQVTTNTNHNQGITGCVAAGFTGSSTTDGVMSHNSFISGGQRLDNDNAFGAARLCNSLFFDCDNAKVLTATLSATVDTAVNVDPGFNWDCLVTIGVPRAGGASGSEAEIYLGFYDKTNQGCTIWNSANGQSGGDAALSIRNDSVGGELDLGGPALDYRIEAATAAGTSCDLTPRNGGGDSDTVFCLFLGWASAETVSVVSWDAPTTTGNNADTSAGFTPQAALHLFSFATAYNTVYATATAGAFGVGMDTDGDNFCVSVQDEVGAVNTDVQSITYNDSIFVEEDDGTDGHKATFVSFDATGWTHNFSISRGTTQKFISLVFEEEVVGGSSLPLLNSNSGGGF